jgi:hypothetical protein
VRPPGHSGGVGARAGVPMIVARAPEAA